MIIRSYRGQIVAVRQTEHANQCGDFGRRWGNADVPPPVPRELVALGAEEHDNGWMEWDAAPKVDPATHRPYQFNRIPLADHVEIERRGIRRATALDPFAGLLTCLHARRLYGWAFAGVPPLGRQPADDAEADVIRRFQADAEQTAIALLAELAARPVDETAVAEANLHHSYRLVELWDWLSLLTILGTDRERSLGPAALARADEDAGIIRFHQVDDWTYTLDPYPFDGDPLITPVPALLLPDRPYRDDDAVRALWTVAEQTTLPITFSQRRG